MPQKEDEIKRSTPAESPRSIATLWQKFHFSGRVIMCSVLFGLGLILIGGLVFAINMDDGTKNSNKSEDFDELMPTKAPANYVGPVVMGIGGFIVVVGVIMCLFETQVCRKKTADAKPLISDKSEDVEARESDLSAIPSSSHSHKTHKHKSRKASSSPRRTKNKHAKSQSPEKNITSAKSPPVFIDKSKSFMTSSEDKFLTPPNTLDEDAELAHSNSRDVDIQTSSSLMKSFTSSGKSWNQSSEFLTPTASLKENSISLDNSVEIDEKESQVNLTTSEVAEVDYTRAEYMTPFEAEEEKIQRLFNQVKNEYIEESKSQPKKNETVLNLNVGKKNDNNAESNVGINVKNINMDNPKNDLPISVVLDVSDLKEKEDDKLVQSPSDISVDFRSKSIDGENSAFENFSSISNIPDEGLASNKNEVECVLPNVSDKIEKEICNDKDIASSMHESSSYIKNEAENKMNDKLPQISEKVDFLAPHDSLTSPVNEAENIPKSNAVPSNEKNCKTIVQMDLENSTSSDETLVSRDNSIEKAKESDVSTLLPISKDSSIISNLPESPEGIKHSSNVGISDPNDFSTGIPKAEKVGASDLIGSEINVKEAESTEEISAGKSS